MQVSYIFIIPASRSAAYIILSMQLQNQLAVASHFLCMQVQILQELYIRISMLFCNYHLMFMFITWLHILRYLFIHLGPCIIT